MKLLLLLLFLGCLPDRPEETIPPPVIKSPAPENTEPENLPLPGSSKKLPDSVGSGAGDTTTSNPGTNKPLPTVTATADVKKPEILSPNPGNATGPKPSCQKMYVTNTSGNGVLMRKGAGIQYEGLLPPIAEGELVTTIGTEGDWTDAAIDNRLGYIDSRNLSCTKVTPQDPTNQTVEESRPTSTGPTKDTSSASRNSPKESADKCE